MRKDTARWARTHAFGGRIVGEFTSTDAPPRQMAVIMTLRGPGGAPRDSLIPLDHDDVLDAAERVGYTPEEIRAAVELALRRKGVRSE